MHSSGLGGGHCGALRMLLQLAELHAAASEPCQVAAAQLGDTRTIDPLDELLIVLGEVAAAFVAAIDQAADADPADVTVQNSSVADVEELLGLPRGQLEAAHREGNARVLLLLLGEPDRRLGQPDQATQESQFPVVENIF